MKKKCSIGVIIIALLAFFPAGAQLDAGRINIGIYGGGEKLTSYTLYRSNIAPCAGLNFGFTMTPHLTLALSGGYGWGYPADESKSGAAMHLSIDPNSTFSTVQIPLLADLKINLNPDAKLNPYLMAGGGALVWQQKVGDSSRSGWIQDAMVNGGIGLEWFLSEAFGIDMSVRSEWLLFQKHDGTVCGDIRTGIIEGRVGIGYYFGGKRDSDNDGILDKVDSCPNAAEDFDGFQDGDGCPDYDNDNDGVPDSLDKCPAMAGPTENKGCPDVDSDQDGVVDRLDKCKDVPEDKDAFEDEDGCPDPDNDKDGVPDSVDKCKNVSGLSENNGCPDFDSDNDGIVDRLDKCPNNPGPASTGGCPQTQQITRAGLILKGVYFQAGKAVIPPATYSALDSVVTSLKEWPEVNIEIQGHTDITGSVETNRRLSQQRAEAVRQYLIDRGIDGSRLTAVGYGSDVPVADNKTAAGRAKNRRAIQFKRSN
jgi:outer membrane protein OmpA-like peptidoglycan-associated protein